MFTSKKILPILFLAAGSFSIIPTSSCFASKFAAPQHDSKANTVVTINADQAHVQQTHIQQPQQASDQQTVSGRIQKILDDYNKKDTATAPVNPILPNNGLAGSYSILGSAVATPEQCVRYLLRENPKPEITVSPQELVSYYYQEGSKEGVRPDIAFAQAIVETGFFRYGGTVTPDQNNYCGLGTTNTVVKGAYFATPELGVRAHIQHLLAYASDMPPQAPIVDPRYSLVRSIYQQHTLTSWQDLNGRWAVPGDTYGQNILRIYNAILNS
ncbi:glucosaminidase domain-containing protein [Pectinatus cerevisiiphilus]|uniref:Mannosyl-glycoprotein endo-beta-N-acetylglucosaminidase n=1 Tax=Pectinatus cerevisiiphilus TaxID=86956 RepID=A0A4R3K7A0_9FIRM|nr:glucosaminidase domain-containing protein [Pectinatus cerevisiiphilus]TCS78658.1 mannosyl-glycoprotein endo-beta-N-acetylglucosaminidase [Pectinatus cerevisiiphilus]